MLHSLEGEALALAESQIDLAAMHERHKRWAVSASTA
jgi:hypothetical protein